MTPAIGTIQQIIVSNGTPSNSIGRDGQYCYVGLHRRMFYKTSGVWSVLTTWRDEYGELSGKKKKGSRITDDLTEGSIVFSSSCRIADDWVIINTQLNHDKLLTAVVHPHLHWTQTSANVPNWLISYRWQVNGLAKTTAWTNNRYSAHVVNYVSGSLNQITTFADIPAPNGDSLSDVLQFRLMRDTANDSGLFSGADPLVGNAVAVFFDIHFECDNTGSAQEYAK